MVFLTTSAEFSFCVAFRSGYFDVCRWPYVGICCHLYGAAAFTSEFAAAFRVPLAFAGVLAFAAGRPWRLVSVGCCALVRPKPEAPLGKRTGRRACSAARLGMYGAGAISLLSLARDIADIQARSAREIADVRGARTFDGGHALAMR